MDSVAPLPPPSSTAGELEPIVLAARLGLEPADVLISRLRGAIAGGRHAQALPWAYQLMELTPEDPQAHAMLREAQAFAEPSPSVREDALEHLIAALDRWPTSMAIARATANVALARGVRGAAITALARLDELAPNQPMLDDVDQAIEALPVKTRPDGRWIWPKITPKVGGVLASIALVIAVGPVRGALVEAQAPALTNALPPMLECQSLKKEGEDTICVLPAAKLAAYPQQERGARIKNTAIHARESQSARALVVRDPVSGKALATKTTADLR